MLDVLCILCIYCMSVRTDSEKIISLKLINKVILVQPNLDEWLHSRGSRKYTAN